MSRPSDLTEELTLKIRALVLRGTLYKNIQEELNIPDNTWDTWVYKDYKDFRKNLISWKHERIVKKTETLGEEIIDTDHKDENGKILTDLLRIKQKEAEYIRSNLGKSEGYSTRQEVTGKDGKDLPTPILTGIIQTNVQPDHSTNKDSETNKED